MAKSAIMYLKEQLNFKSAEWMELSAQDKEDLRAWAEEEQEFIENEKKGG